MCQNNRGLQVNGCNVFNVCKHFLNVAKYFGDHDLMKIIIIIDWIYIVLKVLHSKGGISLTTTSM